MSNQDLTKLSLVPKNREDLIDADKKIGKIEFSRDEKVALAKLVGTKTWDILKGVYVKQRLVQLAVAGINVSQTQDELFFYKGKAAEANQFVKEIEEVVKQFNKDEEAKKTNK